MFFFCATETDRLFVNFLFLSSGVAMRTRKCSFRDAESHKERDNGAYLLEKHLVCVRHLQCDNLVLPLSKRCQDPRRLRVVGTYLRGGEWRRNFPQDKKDAKVFQKIVGATNLVMEN